VAARKNDAAVIDLGRLRGCWNKSGMDFPFRQRAAAGRAPIGSGGLSQHCVALRANALHTASVIESLRGDARGRMFAAYSSRSTSSGRRPRMR
jgi:hypothetical protein